MLVSNYLKRKTLSLNRKLQVTGGPIYDAIGVRIYHLPITSEKILKALKEKEK